MKIISQQVSSTPRIMERAPTKGQAFAQRLKDNSKTQEAITKINSIPKNDLCPTEHTGSPCGASRYAEILRKMHLKMSCKTMHCQTCTRNETKLRFAVGREILCRSKFSNLCIFESEAKCPRIDQANLWLLKCRHKKRVLDKCIHHRSFLTDKKKKLTTKQIILQKINK